MKEAFVPPPNLHLRFFVRNVLFVTHSAGQFRTFKAVLHLRRNRNVPVSTAPPPVLKSTARHPTHSKTFTEKIGHSCEGYRSSPYEKGKEGCIILRENDKHKTQNRIFRLLPPKYECVLSS